MGDKYGYVVEPYWKAIGVVQDETAVRNFC